MATAKATPKGEAIRQIIIGAPNFQTVQFGIAGTAPLVMHKFSQKAKNEMMQTMGASKGKNTSKKGQPKDWDDDLQQAIHYSTEGWIGIPAASFRKAAISACRIVGFKMTLAKLGIFIQPDGFEGDEGTPLVRINGEYRAVDSVVRIPSTGSATVVRRPFFDQWEANITVVYDGDMFSAADLSNLFKRVGMQVGIGEGRPDSKDSAGMGWGTFVIRSVVG